MAARRPPDRSKAETRTRTIRAAMATSPDSRVKIAHMSGAAAVAAMGANGSGAAGAYLEQPTPGNDDPTQAIGAPGNLNVSGFLTGEDYNAQLDGQAAYAVYDQMRRSDAQVQATLAMCKLPVKAATWDVEAAGDDPQDQAIADFVRAALLDEDAMELSWHQILDNVMLKFDFGASASEKIWRLDEAGALRYKALEPRLPRTFYRWIEDPQTGRLQALQQFAPKAGMYGFWTIPVDRLVLHLLNREGNSWYGRALLRASYPHWFYKQQLYRIAAVAADREHQGIARAKILETYKSESAPLDRIITTLKGLRSNEKGYVVQPFGVEYDWMTSQNAEQRMLGTLALLEHHNVMIARSCLQQFSAQGEQKHGSFGAASVTLEAFYDGLEGMVKEICSELRAQVIKPLCAMNFDMTDRASPTLVVSDLGKMDAKALAMAMQQLASAKVITPDDDLEDWVRGIMNAPPLPAELRGQDRTSKPTTVVMPGTPGVVGATPQDAPLDAPVGLARQATARERKFLDLRGIRLRLSQEKTALVSALVKLRRAHASTLAETLAKKDARDTAAFTDLRAKHLPAPDASSIKRAIRGMQQRVAEYGATQVRRELGKQGQHVKALAGQRAASTKKTLNSALVSSADASSDKLVQSWQSLAIENAVRLRRSGLVGKELTDALLAELGAAAETFVARTAGEEVNEAFSLGRAWQAHQVKDQIGAAIYSCVLDDNSCDNCSELDGQEFEIDSDDYEANSPPNPSCDGRDSCRCCWLYIAKGE
jgi:hypothetical protein